MSNFSREQPLNQLLNTSLRAVEACTLQIEKPSTSSKKIGKTTLSDDLVSNLGSILADTRSALQKQLNADSVVRVDMNTVRALETAISRLLQDRSTENKVNALQVAIQGTQTPFWNELKSLQQLLFTLKSLKRGDRTSSVDLDKDAEDR